MLILPRRHGGHREKTQERHWGGIPGLNPWSERAKPGGLTLAGEGCSGERLATQGKGGGGDGLQG